MSGGCTRTARTRIVAVAVLVALTVAGVGLGSPMLGPGQLVEALGDPESLTRTIILDVRLPRIVLAVLVGAGLAVSGLLLQDGLRNDLAGPELLGASSGAALAMAILTMFAIPVPWVLHPMIALLGALAGGALVLSLVGTVSTPERVAVLGAAVSSVLGASVTAVIGLGGDTARVNLLFSYLLGNLSARNWSHVGMVAPAVLIMLAGAVLLGRSVALIKVGESPARALGVRVTAIRVAVLLLAAIVSATVTAACGPVAFIALLAPHLARRVTGESRTAPLIGIVGVLGALLLLVADQAAQLVVYPAEIPVGVMTTVFGVPAMLILLRRRHLARSRPAGMQ